eukprot:6183523-Pleurochrysis_carterae.AAC.4
MARPVSAVPGVIRVSRESVQPEGVLAWCWLRLWWSASTNVDLGGDAFAPAPVSVCHVRVHGKACALLAARMLRHANCVAAEGYARRIE